MNVAPLSNCQAAVDADSQVIVAAEVTNQVNDKQLAPKMMAEVEKNTGKMPKIMTADDAIEKRHINVGQHRTGLRPIKRGPKISNLSAAGR